MIEVIELVAVIAWAFVLICVPRSIGLGWYLFFVVGAVCTGIVCFSHVRLRHEDKSRKDNHLTLSFPKNQGVVTRSGELADRFPDFIREHGIVDEERFAASCILECMDAFEAAKESGESAQISLQIREDHPAGCVLRVLK